MKTAKLSLLTVSVFLSMNSMAASIYGIGNSLTENGVPGFVRLANVNGMTVNEGYHIRYGAPLTYIQANPSDVSLDNSTPYGLYGTYNQALSNNAWDYGLSSHSQGQVLG